MNKSRRERGVLNGLAVGFCALAAAFLLGLWGRPVSLPPIPLVDPQFTNTATVRVSIAQQIEQGTDPSDFDCYICHEKDDPPELRYDENHKLVVPEEHEDIVMGHGSHDRNNNCYNCHKQTNLELLETRDGRELKLANSSPLCGSCHGPTYADWEAGAHGRIDGYWNHSLGQAKRRDCVSCHDPHAPKFPPQKPAPGPSSLHQVAQTEPEKHEHP